MCRNNHIADAGTGHGEVINLIPVRRMSKSARLCAKGKQMSILFFLHFC